MARSPLTLAASVTSALPRVAVVGVGLLTESASGRFDTAVADLDDGRRVVVRAPAETAAVAELAAEARALRALTPGVRGLLPFRAPELLGETGLGDARAVVVDFLPGYRVDAAHLPAGRGAATSIGEALAALHALPLSIVRAEGLPVRTAPQVRADVARTVDRAEATRRAPDALVTRWRRALAVERFWQFEAAVVLGGAGAASFVLDDVDDEPRVIGVLEWHGLSIGDPATDLQWLAGAPTAADDVYESYAAHSSRAPDGLVRERARLFAELEFAKWLVHGHESGRSDVVDDAVDLLESLAESVGRDDLVPDDAIDVDDAIQLLDRVPDGPASADTSMQTDAYDPEQLSQWVSDEEDTGETAPAGDGTLFDPEEPDAAATAPIDISDLIRTERAGAGTAAEPPREAAPLTKPPAAPAEAVDDEQQERDDADRAAAAAMRRWTDAD